MIGVARHGSPRFGMTGLQDSGQGMPQLRVRVGLNAFWFCNTTVIVYLLIGLKIVHRAALAF